MKPIRQRLQRATSLNRMQEPRGRFRRLHTAGVRGGDNRPGADAGDAVKGNAVALEDAENAGVGDAARETATECEPDARRDRCGRRLPQSSSDHLSPRFEARRLP